MITLWKSIKTCLSIKNHSNNLYDHNTKINKCNTTSILYCTQKTQQMTSVFKKKFTHPFVTSQMILGSGYIVPVILYYVTADMY